MLWCLYSLLPAAWVVGAAPIFGISAPALVAGWGTSCLWLGVLLPISVTLSMIHVREIRMPAPWHVAAPLLLVASILSLLLIWKGVTLTTSNRTFVLNLTFTERGLEAKAQQAIMYHYVMVQGGRVVLSASGQKALPAGSRERRRLEAWIANKALHGTDEGRAGHNRPPMPLLWPNPPGTARCFGMSGVIKL